MNSRVVASLYFSDLMRIAVLASCILALGCNSFQEPQDRGRSSSQFLLTLDGDEMCLATLDREKRRLVLESGEVQEIPEGLFVYGILGDCNSILGFDYSGEAIVVLGESPDWISALPDGVQRFFSKQGSYLYVLSNRHEPVEYPSLLHKFDRVTQKNEWTLDLTTMQSQICVAKEAIWIFSFGKSRIVDAETGRLIREFKSDLPIAVAPVNSGVVAAIGLSRAGNGRNIYYLPSHAPDFPIHLMTFDVGVQMIRSDGESLVAFVLENGALEVRNIRNGKIVLEESGISDVLFLPDYSLAVCTDNQEIRFLQVDR